MYSFRGDADKIYRYIKKTSNEIREVKYLKEIEEILIFYQSMDSYSLKLVYYRMIKEKNGSGMIPIFVSAIPWLLFLFSSHLEDFLFTNGSMNWLIFAIVYLLGLSISLYLHFREKAWAAFHIEIIQDILRERKDEVVSEPD
ncbi:hypothetical protein [Oceanobacillus salinisoli]|uniref:hypothetical protein n=1 Tax=Oceanobacillus salinisoli TaxID=2678611 RepID=UPI0012E24B0D|nr:hypothetical protein [Oceanobacillus salinisoli]